MSKNVLIVGGSSGLGKRLAELYVQDGCQVGIIARREELLKEIQQKFPSNIHIRTADICDDMIDEKINALINEMSGIDIMIISASTGEINEELITSIENKTVDVNVKGYLRVLTSAWHYF